MSTLVLLAATLTMPWWPPLVVGDHVVPAVALFIAGGVAALVTHGRAAGARPARVGRAATIVAVLLLPGVLIAFQTLTTSSTVLPHHGPSGCRVVSRESAFLFSGNGELGTIGLPFGFADMQADYRTDDGDRPIGRGDYTLEWHGSGPTLVIGGSWSDAAEWPPDLHC